MTNTRHSTICTNLLPATRPAAQICSYSGSPTAMNVASGLGNLTNLLPAATRLYANSQQWQWWMLVTNWSFGEIVMALIIHLIYHGIAIAVAAAAVLWRKPHWEETTDGCSRSTVNSNHSIQMTMTSDNDCNDNDDRDHDISWSYWKLPMNSGTVFVAAWSILGRNSVAANAKEYKEADEGGEQGRRCPCRREARSTTSRESPWKS